MAINVTALAAANVETDGNTTHVTASVTPTSGSRLFVAYGWTHTAGLAWDDRPTIAAGGTLAGLFGWHCWLYQPTRQTTGFAGAGGAGVCLYELLAHNAGTGAITITTPGGLTPSRTYAQVFEVVATAGEDLSTLWLNVAEGAGTAGQCKLPNAGANVAGYVMVNTDNSAFTPNTGYAELCDLQGTAGVSRFTVGYDATTPDQTPGATMTSDSWVCLSWGIGAAPTAPYPIGPVGPIIANTTSEGATTQRVCRVVGTADRFLVAMLAADNSGTNGAEPGLVITDSVGNSWSVGAVSLQDPGAANAGVASYMAWSDPASNYGASATITYDWTTNVAAKAAATWEFVAPASSIPTFQHRGASASASTSPSVSVIATLPAGAVWIAGTAIEGPGGDTYTPDNDSNDGQFHPLTVYGSYAATATDNAKVAVEWKRLTADTADQVYAPTITSRDWATQSLGIRFDLLKSSSDTAAGADAATTLAASPTAPTDTAAGVDSQTSLQANINLFTTGDAVDVYAVTDSQTLRADISFLTTAGAVDTATVADTESIEVLGAEEEKDSSDTGAAADAQTSLVAHINLFTTGDAVDVYTLTDAVGAVALAGDEPASGAEGSPSVAPSAVDTGATVDAGTVATTVAAGDSASGGDTGSLAASTTAADTATGTDAGAVAAAFSSTDTGAAADTNGSVQLAGNDPASGVEGTPSVAPAATDSGAGADTGAPAATVTGSDTGAAVDAATVGVLVTSSDTATVAETGILSVAQTSSDAAAAVDAQASLVAHLNFLTTGGAVDVYTAADAVARIALTGNDPANGAEGTPSVAPSASDTGAAVDTSAIGVGQSSSDTATAAESTPTLAAAVSGSESATTAEVTLLSAALSASDTATAAETSTIVVARADTDTGTATDAVTRLALAGTDSGAAVETSHIEPLAGDFQGSDSGAATDAVAQLAIAASALDTAVAADAPASLVVAISASDTATTVDTAGARLLAASDNGAGQDQHAITAAATAGDTAGSSESSTIGIPFTDGDTATATDTEAPPHALLGDSGQGVVVAVVSRPPGATVDVAPARRADVGVRTAGGGNTEVRGGDVTTSAPTRRPGVHVES